MRTVDRIEQNRKNKTAGRFRVPPYKRRYRRENRIYLDGSNLRPKFIPVKLIAKKSWSRFDETLAEQGLSRPYWLVLCLIVNSA
jgi:hypothetical protein